MTRITTVAELRDLPDGTVFVSEPDCLWSGRYAGVRWQKKDNWTIWCLDKEDNWGFDKSKTVSALSHFKDPLPARVIEENND